MPGKNEDQEKRAFSHGSSSSTADMAVEGTPKPEDRHIEAPAARRVDPLKEGEKHDHMAEKHVDGEDRQEALLDEALEETYPGSDPISPKHIT